MIYSPLHAVVNEIVRTNKHRICTNYCALSMISGAVYAVVACPPVRPLVPEILDQSDGISANSPIFDLFTLVAPQP